MSALVPDACASSWRCGHSISIGATARNSGPGKLPRLPIADSASASSIASSASRSASAGADIGSTGTKSTVPATRVLKFSVGKRVIARIPDLPAVSLAQLSVLPAPSDVTTPMPVTTTMGRPDLSRNCAISVLPKRSNWFQQREAFAAPMADPGDDCASKPSRHRLLDPGRIKRWKQFTVIQGKRRNCNIHAELRLKAVSEMASRRANRNVRVARQEGALFRSGWLGPRGAGNDRGARVGNTQLRPHPLEAGFDRSWTARAGLHRHGG